MIRTFVTFFGIGLLHPAPGTWGSLAALPVAWAIATLGGPLALALALVAVILAGTWAIGLATTGADPDPSEIVIDEVAGQWLAILPVVVGAWWFKVDMTHLWPGWVAGFVLFRLFDVWKPGPVGRADRRGDALGVMLDDIVAGALAAVGVMILAILAHAPMFL